jgi:hypothetical protein
MNFSRTHPIAVRHTESGHGIQSRTANVGLGDLSIEAARLELSAEQGLEPEHGRLGEAAPVVVTLLFPLRQADLTDTFQNCRARMHRAIRTRLPGWAFSRGGMAALA